MSLPTFSTQSELFSTAGLSASLFEETDRSRLFAKVVDPHLAATRAALEPCDCADNGRTAIEPVLRLGVSLLQYLDGMPDRQAVEMLHDHAGWNFALNRPLGDPVFHPTSLVNFRHRLEENQQSALGFQTILEALVEAGLVSRQSRQRLDSTPMMGRVARMNRLDCVREAMRLALQELEAVTPSVERPRCWIGFGERDVESQVDYRASSEVLGNKLGQTGTDVWPLLEWLGQPAQGNRSRGTQVQLLNRVFGEQFEVRVGQGAPLPKEKEPLVAAAPAAPPQAQEAVADPAVAPPGVAAPDALSRPASASTGSVRSGQKWSKSQRPWGWKSRRCNMSMALTCRRKSWCKLKPKAES